MKKLFIWLIPVIIVAVIAAGILVGILVQNNQSNLIVYANSLQCKYDSLTFKKDVVYNISNDDFIVLPATCNQKILLSTNDSNILDVNANTGEVFAKSTGSCYLIASIKTSEDSTTQIEIPVNVNNASQTQKVEKHVSLTFNLSEGYSVITYSANEAFENYSCNVIEGDEHVAILEFEHRKITINLVSSGTSKICLENSTQKIIYEISVV